MTDYEENGVIEATLIVEESLGEVITEPRKMDIEEVCRTLRAQEILLHAGCYLEDQIPEYLKGIYL